MQTFDDDATAIPVFREPETQAVAPARQHDEVILVVDPDVKARRAMCDALETHRYTVLEASNAVQAHMLLGHLSTAPDLVVVGPELAEPLAADSRSPRLLVIPFHQPFAHHRLGQRVRAAFDALRQVAERRALKNARSSSAHSASLTPPTTSAR